MKAADPFADDLDDFDAIVAALRTTRSRQDEPVARAPTVLLSSTPASSFATMTTTTGATAMTSPMMTNATGVLRGRRAAAVQVPQFLLASPTAAPSPTAAMTTTGATNAAANFVASATYANDDAHDEDDPLAFLETNAQSFSGAAATTNASSRPNVTGAAPRDDRLAVNSAASERHELLATLDALDTELTELEGRLETAQIKEDAELLKLDTDLIEKRMAIAAEESQAATRRTALQEQTTQQLAALEQRAVQERQAQDDEIAELEKSRYARLSTELTSVLTTVTASVAALQQQCALIVSRQPFSPRGLRLALGARTMDDDTGDAVTAGDAGMTANRVAPSPSPPPASMLVAHDIERALALLRGYCDDRVRRMRDRVVDHLHAATTDAAGVVRATHLTTWARDAAGRKARLAEYAERAVARYRDFVQARAELKERNLTMLRAQLRQTTDELRERAKARLDALLREVSEKLERGLRDFDDSAAATRRSLEQRAAATRDADTAMAQAQLHEVGARCGAEAAVQRRLHGAQRASLQEQLAKMQAQGDDDTHNRFAALQAEASAASRRASERVRARLGDLHDAVERALRESSSVAATTMATARLDTAAHVQELEYTSGALLRQLAGEQEELGRSRARAQSLRCNLCTRFRDELLAKLHAARATQQAQQATADFVRLSWEKECRQQLIGGAAGSSPAHGLSSLLLVLPPPPASASVSLSGQELVTQELCTTTPVREVAAADMLEYLVEQLRRRDNARDALRACHVKCATATRTRLDTLRGRCARLYTLWSQLLRKLEACDEAQARLTQQQIAVEKETVRMELARQEIAREHGELTRRCVQLEKQGALCAKERAAVMGAHAHLQEVLQEFIGSHVSEVQVSGGRTVSRVKSRDVATPATRATIYETDTSRPGGASPFRVTPTCAVVTTSVQSKSASASTAPSSLPRHSADKAEAVPSAGVEPRASATTPPPRECASQISHRTLPTSPLSSSSLYCSSPFIDMVPLATSTNTSVCTM